MSGPGPGGLQAERTALAWTRTSLGLLVNGVLLIVKYPNQHGGLQHAIAASLAGVLAVVVYVVGLHRERTLTRQRQPEQMTARFEVQLVGAAVLLLIAITAAGLFV